MADNNVNWNGWVTPDLARNPGLASDTLNSKDPNSVAPILSHTAQGVAVGDAINDHMENNDTQSFWAKLGAGTVNTLTWLGKPLKEVQKDYKFIHSVYKDHGVLAGFTATLGITAGGAAGFIAGGPVGAMLGADLAGATTRKLLGNIFTDSYKKSEDENYKISPGRDFSNALAKASDAIGADGVAKVFRDTSSGLGKFTSGIADLGFDINSDPIMAVSKFATLMKTGKLLKAGETELRYPIMNTVPGAKDFILSHTGVPLTSEQMDMVRANAGKFMGVGAQYNRALDDIASTVKTAIESGKPSVAAGEIVQKYPQLGTQAAGRIATQGLTTADEVHNFLKTSVYFGELQGSIAGQAILPSRTLLRAKLGDSTVVDALRNASVSKYILDDAGNRIKNPEWNPLSPKQRAGNIYKTFSGYMPYSVDPETKKLSLTKFAWNSPDSANVIYRIARFGMGDQAAKDWAGQYAQAIAPGTEEAIGLARGIKNQAIFETFKALGLPDEPGLVKEVWDEIQKIDTPNVSSQIFGASYTGAPLGEFITNDGNRAVAGLQKRQMVTMFNIPDFNAIKTAMRDAGKFSKYVGKIDDFTASKYTNNIFKPLALATAGFGLRIAASELIPTFARYGVMNTIKARIAAAAGKSQYDLIKGEDEHIASAALTALSDGETISPDVLKEGFPAFQKAKGMGLKFAEKLTPQDQIDLATRVVMQNNAQFLPDVVKTGHGYDANVSFLNSKSTHYYYQIEKRGPLFRETPEYTTYTATDNHYAPTLISNLNKASKEVSNSKIAEDILRYQKNYAKAFKQEGQLVPVSPKLTTGEFYDTPEFQDLRSALINSEYNRMAATNAGKFKPYEPERKLSTRWRTGDLRQFAQDRVDNTLGMLVGKDGTFHEDWAQRLANMQEVNADSIVQISKTSPQSLPAAVAGPVLKEEVPGNRLFNYIINVGFKKVIDPIVNNISRVGLYQLHVGDAYARMLPQIRNGFLEPDQALRIAQTQASYAMLPQIHNTALRNQFAQLARNFLPFYFAQEQALKRAYNTLKDTSIASPAFSEGMRFYQLAEHAMSDPTFMTTDDNGNKFINIPLVGEFGKAVQGALGAYGVPIVTGLPITVKGSTVSLKSVLPELQTPGVSPFMAISGNLLADFFPTMKPIVKGTIGDISFQKGILDTLVPAAWAKTALATLTPIDLQNQMNNALMSALASAYYNGKVPDANNTDMDRQNYIEVIKNNARSILMIKAFLNLVSPLAPQVKQEDAGFREEFQKLVKKYNNNYTDAVQAFIAEHGSRAVSYTVGKTEASFRGGKLPYIQATVDYINEHKDMFKYNSGISAGAFFLIPQDNSKNESDRTIYNELMAMHFRSQRTPAEMLRQFYVAQGYAAISPLIKEHVTNVAQAGNIPFLKQQEQQRWTGVIDKMKNLYPVWYSDYTNPDRATDALKVVNQLNQIFAPNKQDQWPKHEQAVMVKDLLDRYNQYQSQKSLFTMMNIRGTASQMSKQDWEDYLMAKAEEDPRLHSVIYSVFLKLG